MVCLKGHEHPSEASLVACNDGQVFWWGCSLMEESNMINAHFFHVSQEERDICEFNRAPTGYCLYRDSKEA
jgi:hypothetical protein